MEDVAGSPEHAEGATILVMGCGLSFSLVIPLCGDICVATAVLSSGMVLQQNDSVTLWGWSQPAEKIFITTGWNNRTDSVTADNGANWKIKIKTPAAGGPFSIVFKGYNIVELKDVLIGEVWICSGQSNMEMNEHWGLPDLVHRRAASASEYLDRWLPFGGRFLSVDALLAAAVVRAGEQLTQPSDDRGTSVF